MMWLSRSGYLPFVPAKAETQGNNRYRACLALDSPLAQE